MNHEQMDVNRHFAGNRLRNSRFDHLVWAAVGVILVLIGLVILRGDQLALQITRLNPAPDAVGISTRARITIEFDQPLGPLPPGAQLRFAPPVAGNLQVSGNVLSFLPSEALLPYTTYNATSQIPLRGQQGGELRMPLELRFTTGGLQVVYIALDAEGKEQIFVADTQHNQAPTGQEDLAATPQQVTTGPLNVWDFSISPTTGEVTYSAIKEDGTSDLHTIQPGGTATVLVPCPNAVCNSSAWSPDGRLLAYSRRNTSEFGAAALNPPRLWLFDPATRETVSLFPDNQQLSFQPAWSADGAWLSYLSPDPAGIGIVNITTGTNLFYPTPTGETAVWHPQALRFAYSVLKQIGNDYVTHLHVVDLDQAENSEGEVNISGDASHVEDNAPAWSPDGEWLAFRRKTLTGPGATPGKQLWRMRADGSDAEPLTSDPAFDHSHPQWSPDGRYLLFHKLPLKGPEITLSVWILDVESGEGRELARPGQRPQWLP